ncbi:Gfo/Idh/MocA family protein [Chloroflexota bacterium]
MKIAVCGTGQWAEQHIKEIGRHPFFDVAMIYSENLSRARRLAEKVNLPYSDNINDILACEEIECFDIVTTNNRHFPYSLQALGASKHVIVEKPAVFKLRELEELVNLAREKNKIILIGFQKKLGEIYKRVTKEYHNNKYGDPIYALSNVIVPRKRAYFNERQSSRDISGGGVLIYSAVHELDMMINLFGKVERIFGYYENISHDLPVEDTANLTLVFQNGVVYNLFTTYADTPRSLLFRNKNFFIENEVAFENRHIIFSEFHMHAFKEWGLHLPGLGRALISYSFNRYLKPKRGTFYDVLTELYNSLHQPDYNSVLAAGNSCETHRVIEYFYDNCVSQSRIKGTEK